MSTSLPVRGALTDQLIAYQSEALAGLAIEILVGDGERPVGSGWPATPQVGDFVSYVTIDTGPGQLDASQTPTLASQHSSWLLSYAFLSVGAARRQADAIADVVRNACVSFKERSPLTLGVETWAIESVLFTRIGSVDRNTATDPPFWQVQDSMTLKITRNARRGSSAV